jgi:hypothetical protein
VQADEITGISESSAELRMYSRDRGRDRNRFHTGKELLDDCSSTGATCSGGAVDAV